MTGPTDTMGEEAVSILGLESVTMGVEDIEASARLLHDFGLVQVERGEHGATFVTSEGSCVELRCSTDAALPPPAAPGMPLRRVVWGVDNRAALDALAASLCTDREVSAEGNRVQVAGPDGLMLAFEVSSLQRQPPSSESRAAGQRLELPARAAPSHFGHVVVEVGSPDAADFYVERLGFQVTDTNMQGTFMKCDGSTNHHNLLLMPGRPPGLHHVSFRVSGIDEMMIGKEHLEANGWRSVWGPGRHPIGSQLFCYFENPAGGFIEYHADEDVVPDVSAWQPRRWDPVSALSWGGPPLNMIKATKG